jgi:methionyl-tRNA formyltransferase
VNDNRLIVGCGDGCIGILELQAEGKRRMGVAEFLRGNGIQANSRFV